MIDVSTPWPILGAVADDDGAAGGMEEGHSGLPADVRVRFSNPDLRVGVLLVASAGKAARIRGGESGRDRGKDRPRGERLRPGSEKDEMPQEFFIKELPNGMTLLGQRMEHVSSTAMSMLVPCGAAHDPAGQEGAASVLCEWCFRGAGPRDSRQLNDALDFLGCQHSENVLSEQLQFSAAQLGRNLPDVVAIYADILRRPRLDDDTFEPCRDLALQDLEALEDEPARKCNIILRDKFYPSPLGRSVYGEPASLEALAAPAVRDHARGRLTPQGAILAVAGAIDWPAFCALAQRHFGDWSGPAPAAIDTAPAVGGVTFVHKETSQTHLALAHEAVPADHPSYYAARLAESVLSGGMSSRLFTEVRDKRGLAYHVSSRYHSLKHLAGMFTYAGAGPQQAQETLEVTVRELQRLSEGIGEDELERSRVQLKAGLIMQGESTPARAGALVGDWYHLGRLRSLEELSAAIENTGVNDILDYLRQYPPRRFTMLVVGPSPLDAKAVEA